jgi:uncharacterized membrane protein YcjF (UPF0283 family)
MEEINDMMSVYADENDRSLVTASYNSNEYDDDDDDDDDDEIGADGATTTETDPEPVDRRRDEMGEVRKMSLKDTNRLRFWRIVVTGVLLLTAFAVTYTTYNLLKQQEEENFQTAVSAFVVVIFGTLLYLLFFCSRTK